MTELSVGQRAELISILADTFAEGMDIGDLIEYYVRHETESLENESDMYLIELAVYNAVDIPDD